MIMEKLEVSVIKRVFTENSFTTISHWTVFNLTCLCAFYWFNCTSSGVWRGNMPAMRFVITSLMLIHPSCICFLYRRRVQGEHVKQHICVYYTKDERIKREGETEIWHN